MRVERRRRQKKEFVAACKRKGVRVAGKNLAGEAQGGQEVGWPAIATPPLLHSSPQRNVPPTSLLPAAARS